jgi:hypothetical protein
MELVFTLHALQRCALREIKEADVRRTVEQGNIVSHDHASYTVKYGRLCVVVSSKTGVIITAYKRKRNAVKKMMKRKRQENARRMRADKHCRIY